MVNLEIRRAVLDNGITYRRIAAVMDIKPSNLSALMSRELKPAKQEEIYKAINRLAAEDRKAAQERAAAYRTESEVAAR